MHGLDLVSATGWGSIEPEARNAKFRSFRKIFISPKLVLGEACGCAESVINVFEFDPKGGAEAKQSLLSIRAWAFEIQITQPEAAALNIRAS